MEDIARTIVLDEDKDAVLAVLWKNDHWVFPGGHREKGERTIDAAWREMMEECNLFLDKNKMQKISEVTLKDKSIHYYKCEILQSQKSQIRAEAGSLVTWMNIQDFVQQVPERFRPGVIEALRIAKEK